jgi:hypothetical protein
MHQNEHIAGFSLVGVPILHERTNNPLGKEPYSVRVALLPMLMSHVQRTLEHSQQLSYSQQNWPVACVI